MAEKAMVSGQGATRFQRPDNLFTSWGSRSFRVLNMVTICSGRILGLTDFQGLQQPLVSSWQ